MTEQMVSPYQSPLMRREALLGSVCVEAIHQPKVDAMVDALLSVSPPLPDALAKTLLRQRVLLDGLADELKEPTTY